MARHRLYGAGVVDIDTVTPSSITSHEPGYLDKEKCVCAWRCTFEERCFDAAFRCVVCVVCLCFRELIVGLQTDAPLKRSIKPFGGINVVKTACESYGYEVDPETESIFRKYRTTHNDGVFKAYTPEMRKVSTADHGHTRCLVDILCGVLWVGVRVHRLDVRVSLPACRMRTGVDESSATTGVSLCTVWMSSFVTSRPTS